MNNLAEISLCNFTIKFIGEGFINFNRNSILLIKNSYFEFQNILNNAGIISSDFKNKINFLNSTIKGSPTIICKEYFSLIIII